MVNRLVDRHIHYDTHAMDVGSEEESVLVSTYVSLVPMHISCSSAIRVMYSMKTYPL